MVCVMSIVIMIVVFAVPDSLLSAGLYEECSILGCAFFTAFNGNWLGCEPSTVPPHTQCATWSASKARYHIHRGEGGAADDAHLALRVAVVRHRRRRHVLRHMGSWGLGSLPSARFGKASQSAWLQIR